MTQNQGNSQSLHLAVDIGNTNVVLGVFENSELKGTWRLNTRKNITSDEIQLTLKDILMSGSGSFSGITEIALASVVPGITHQWSNALMEVLNTRAHLINSRNCPDLKLEFDFPEEIGADRLCNILACQALQIDDAIVIDFGTATTFDVYHRGTYYGGLICPGVNSSMQALTENASRLWDVDLFWNESIIGRNTDDALRNGILYGTLGQMEYIIKKIIEERSMNSPEIIATGGLASLIGNRSLSLEKLKKI